MSVRAAGKAVIILVFFIFCAGCGELDTHFPSNGSYQVKTLVNGGSLEDCSIIRFGDTIRPYFSDSVVNDPDLIGLLVYVRDSQGEIIGERIRYTLDSYVEQIYPAETETEVEAKPDTGADKTLEVIENNATGEETTAESPNPGAVQRKWSFIGSGNAAVTAQSTDIVVTVTSLDKELPAFLLLKTLKTGPYKLIFEAFGKKEALSRTETDIFYLGAAEFNLRDILMYLPEESGSRLIPPGTMVMLETRLDFDSWLDPYVIWYNGKSIIRQGKISDGIGNILWKAPEQAGFYSLRAEVFPFQLERRFAGISQEITLPVSPKVRNSGYFFENDRKHSAKSPLAAGTVYPARVQLFHTLVEGAGSDVQNIPVPPSPPELLQWYQLRGNLDGTLSTQSGRQPLLPLEGHAPHWAVAGQSYGLAAESDMVYSLAPVKFLREEREQGGGIFLLHVKPVAAGTFFSVFFPSQSSPAEGVWMSITHKEGRIILYLKASAASAEIPVYLPLFEASAFMPIAVEFYIRPGRLEAKISLEAAQVQYSMEGSIQLSGALTGEAVISLGKASDAVVPVNFTETAVIPAPDVIEFSAGEAPTDSGEVLSAATETMTDMPVTEPARLAARQSRQDTFSTSTIWDEFSILLSHAPILREELTVTATEENNVSRNKNDAVNQFIEIPIIDSRPENLPVEKLTKTNQEDENVPAAEIETEESMEQGSLIELSENF